MTAEEAIAKTSAELKKRMKDSSSIQKLLRRINSGKVTFADTAEHSNQVALMVGDVLSDCVRDPQTAKFSGRVAEALLKEQYEEINSVMQTVQAALDKQRGLHIAPQKAALPLDRIKAAAYSLVDVKATAEQLVRRAESAPVTVVRSYHDQYIHENAMFRSSAGLRCFLVRTTDGKCCEWCSAKAGRYEYGEHPEDIFRRHDNCGCTVTYENGRQRQNVWSKEKWEVPEAGAGAPKPAVLNYARGKELQAKNMQYRGLTSPAQGGIIKTEANASRNLPNGLRTMPSHILTEQEIADLRRDIIAIEADESIFKFNCGRRTGYDDILDEIRVRGDILPDLNSNHPRDKMSARAALAHEYYGHRVNRGTKLPQGAWNDEFRASYSAAKNCPNLSAEDRYYLILDALERAKESGVTIKHNDFIRRTLYGY